jgi:hypothetical protein
MKQSTKFAGCRGLVGADRTPPRTEITKKLQCLVGHPRTTAQMKTMLRVATVGSVADEFAQKPDRIAVFSLQFDIRRF